MGAKEFGGSGTLELADCQLTFRGKVESLGVQAGQSFILEHDLSRDVEVEQRFFGCRLYIADGEQVAAVHPKDAPLRASTWIALLRGQRVKAMRRDSFVVRLFKSTLRR